MDLKIKGKWFIVCGASSGFGRATAERLLEEGAGILAIARREEQLAMLRSSYPERCKVFAADLSQPETLIQLEKEFKLSEFSGAFINAGGPPAMSVMETRPKDWDAAFNLVVKWKVALTQMLVPVFIKNGYGKIVYVESVSVKQPVENLVLSNSLRMAMVGFVKTLSQEIAGKNISLNIMAPGYHDTAAIQRIFQKKSELNGISLEEARESLLSHIPAGKMGTADDFASLSAWLLSPLSDYVNGQTIIVDGGASRASL
ncbi:MAG: SDR family oxidoreductase [Bacteroidales bacterium]|nr:SDR family oxidoreductase [Bacteroidales bacterium]MCB8999092.1 SDR family oxidoreductase [Bacteroidales bacterium]